MPSILSLTLGSLLTSLGVTVLGGIGQKDTTDSTVVRVSSGTPGREVHFQGVVLVANQQMRMVEQATPFEFRSHQALVFAAFEPADSAGLLRLELTSETPEPAVITAPRVMVGRQIGGVATEFVQGY